MQPTKLNSTQLFLLQMFSRQTDEQRTKEMKEVLFKYYCDKADEEIEKVWKEKGMSNETISALRNAHYRTPYKQ